MTTIRDWNIKCYDAASRVLGLKGSRRLGYETRLLQHGDGTISVIHHATPIVTYFPNGVVQINTNGYHTSTTKDRVNLFSPAWIRQHKFTWEVFQDGAWVPFEDGMCFAPNGKLVGYCDEFVPMVAREMAMRA